MSAMLSRLLYSEVFWLVVGFGGQAVFTARFLVQWVASERKRDSVVPVAFWWLSMVGGLTLLSYAIHKRDPVIIAGQSMGVFIYARNLMLVAKGRRRAARRSAVGPGTPSGDGGGLAGPHAGREARGVRSKAD